MNEPASAPEVLLLDEPAFDAAARAELRMIEDALDGIDPDLADVSSADGILRLELRDGTRVVINSHRAARQIWMAAVATAWHFDPVVAGRWVARRTGEELRQTLSELLVRHIGVTPPL